MSNSTFDSNPSSNGKIPENTFKILLATDIHLGFDENNPETGDDSFNTFEEILMLANSRDVDFILLAGDLFHKAQPSTSCLNRCIQLLRTYTLGSKNINFEIVDVDGNKMTLEPNNNSAAFLGPANFEDDNMNISFPVFTIHGNHDDVVNNLSAIDILNSSGLVNYFGKWDNLKQVELEPIIFRKGITSVALYGLSHIPDRRLFDLFKNDKIIVKFIGDPADVNKNYFNIFAIHQNRAERGRNNTIGVEMLPQLMNLVVWGHEHDCRIEAEEYNKVFVTQPGSSVATSLCEGESIQKKVGILSVCYDPTSDLDEKFFFAINPVPLKTVRPFIFRSIDLIDYQEEIDTSSGSVNEKMENFLDKIVLDMITESKKMHTSHYRQPKKPLIRLRVNYDNPDYLINTRRYGQRYADFVAKNEEMLVFKKNIRRLKSERPNVDGDELDEAHERHSQMERVEDLVDSYFKRLTDESDKLKMFNFKSLSDVVRTLIDKEDDEGARKIIQRQVDAGIEFLLASVETSEHLPDALQKFRDEKSSQIHDTVLQALAVSKKELLTGGSDVKPSAVKDEKKTSENEDNESEKEEPEAPVRKAVVETPQDSDSDFEMGETDATRLSTKRPIDLPASPPKRGRGSRGGARGGSTRGRGKATKSASTSEVSQSQNTTRATRSTKDTSACMKEALAGRTSRRTNIVTSTQKNIESEPYSFMISSEDDD